LPPPTRFPFKPDVDSSPIYGEVEVAAPRRQTAKKPDGTPTKAGGAEPDEGLIITPGFAVPLKVKKIINIFWVKKIIIKIMKHPQLQ
jgi:hypothetical protein